MSRPATRSLAAIDAGVHRGAESGFRDHLGASVIGRDCARQVWYIFHWFHRVQHEARMLRLFDRGHHEEHQFIRLLNDAGIAVQEKNPTTGRQWRVEEHEGHFGGSLDAKVSHVPDWPDLDAWLLGEFKTFNLKNFKKLVESGVQKAKPEHYVQMQVYMHLAELPGALYLGVCKDDDTLHTEVVDYDRDCALWALDRALRLIGARTPPPRISESPSWWQCKFCDFYQVCHYGAPIALNCRTCVHALPGRGKSWVCQRYSVELTKEQQVMGCRDHSPYDNR